MNRFPRYIATAFLGAAGWAVIAHWHGSAAQADSTYTYIPTTTKYIVRSANIGPESFETVRMDTATGDAWYANAGKWVKYPDDTPPGNGTYDFQFLGTEDGKSYNLVRTDLNTGRTWFISNMKWLLVAEQ
jgi:hypothetical protein